MTDYMASLMRARKTLAVEIDAIYRLEGDTDRYYSMVDAYESIKWSIVYLERKQNEKGTN